MKIDAGITPKRPSSVDVQTSLESLIESKGYAVIGFPPNTSTFDIGDTTPFFAGFDLEGKRLRVVGKARYSDWKAQCEWFGENNPTWPKMIVVQIPGAHYRKVVLEDDGL